MSFRKSTPSKPNYQPLQTFFQPIVDIRKNKILGYEALTRGHGKFRSPGDIFRFSYETGCTPFVDFDCFKSAFRILPRLAASQFLFVNVEPITLNDFFTKGDAVDLLLKKLGPSREQIVFELTEGMKARDFRYVKRGVAFMKRRGCRFAVDDVAGVGAKLFSLLSLQPDFLKIDISLVRGVWKNSLQQGLLARVLETGRRKGCRIVAEGVEQKKDLDYIRRLGIPYVQGFYFGRPQRDLPKK